MQFKDQSKTRYKRIKENITQLKWDLEFEKLIMSGINSIKAVNILDNKYIIQNEEKYWVD